MWFEPQFLRNVDINLQHYHLSKHKMQQFQFSQSDVAGHSFICSPPQLPRVVVAVCQQRSDPSQQQQRGFAKVAVWRHTHKKRSQAPSTAGYTSEEVTNVAVRRTIQGTSQQKKRATKPIQAPNRSSILNFTASKMLWSKSHRSSGDKRYGNLQQCRPAR